MRLCCLLLLFACSLSIAQEVTNNIDIAVSRIPGVTVEDDASAPYNRLLRLLIDETHIGMRKAYYPTVRSNYLMENKQVNCVFPVARGAYRRDVKTLYSLPVNRVTTHLFSYTEKPYESLSEVANEVVVYIRGYLFGELVNTKPHNVTFVPVDSNIKALELLKNGRAKAYLEYMPDARFSLSKEQFNKLRYSAEQPVQVTFDIFECYDSETNRNFIRDINHVLTDLEKSGRLKNVLGSYYNL